MCECNVWGVQQWCQLTWQANLNRKFRTVSAWALSIGSVLPGSTFGITVGTMLELVPDAWRFLNSEFRLGSSTEGRFTPTPNGTAAIWTKQHSKAAASVMPRDFEHHCMSWVLTSCVSDSSLIRCSSHLIITSESSTASFRCSMVPVGLKPSRWMEFTMCCTRWWRTG